METERNCCQHCQLPLRTCLENDDNLNKPLNTKFIVSKQTWLPYQLNRQERAVKRCLGLYDAAKNVYYSYNKISMRLFNDTVLSLPPCIFTDNDAILGLNTTRHSVIKCNIKDLLVDAEYKNFLFILLTDESDRLIEFMREAMGINCN